MLVTTFGGAEGPTLSTYKDIKIGSLEGFTDGTADVNFYVLLLGARLILVDGLKILTYKVTELGFWYGKLLGKTFGLIHTLYIC